MYLIPEKIKVGFKDEMAFIVPIRNGKPGSPNAFENWRNKKIEPIEIDNIPLSGFIITDVDKRSNDWFGSGRNVFQIKTSQGYLVEISSENLFEIIKNSDLNHGKIYEECIWAWKGAKKALVPITSDFYKEILENMEMIESSNIELNDLISMTTYEVLKEKQKQTLLYLGKFLIEGNEVNSYYKNHNSIKKTEERKFVSKETYVFALKSEELNYIDLISIVNPIVKKALKIKPFKEKKFFLNCFSELIRTKKISGNVFSNHLVPIKCNSWDFEFTKIKEIK